MTETSATELPMQACWRAIRDRAAREQVPFDLTVEYLQAFFDHGIRTFFGFVVNNKGAIVYHPADDVMKVSVTSGATTAAEVKRDNAGASTAATATPQAATALVIRAVYFASERHKHQRRKDAAQSPNIGHPIHVMKLLVDAGVTDPDTLAAAVLHDVVEDCKVTYEELTAEFGAKVAALVRECSDDKKLAKEKRKQVQIEHAASASAGAKLIKLADKWSNVSDLYENPPATWSATERRGYLVWTMAVWLQLRGTNDFFDQLFAGLYQKAGILDMTKQELATELATYYGAIQSSD